MTARTDRLRRLEIWISWIRLLAVPWAVVEVGFLAHDYPDDYATWAWVITAALGVGALALAFLARRVESEGAFARLGLGALAFDTAVIAAYYFLFAYEPGRPTRALIFLAVVEAAVRYGIRGGVGLPLVLVPLLAVTEWWRADRFDPPPFELRQITLPLGVQLITGLIVGGLVRQLRRETAVAEARAAEAEDLRDRMGRRADQLEVVSRAARALASSLDLQQAFRAFVREARTVVPFERLALVLSDRGRAEIIANAGVGAETVYPAGTSQPIEGSVLEDLVAGGHAIVIGDMRDEPQYPEDRELARAGLRSRAVAPLGLAGRVLGMISVCRTEAFAFTREDLDLLTSLGRQLATAIENIRAYEAERTAAEELRRLSALRADFVSLVSHELRGPIASVIGCASTLRQRWRSLTPGQRESFLGLIETETSRLAALVGDVLDTSRLEAGTFSYTFSTVDLEELVREVAALIDIGQEEVEVTAEVAGPLPPVRADRDRIRQLLVNLATNAVKYTHSGDEVEIRASAADGAVAISVSDHGPGISSEEQRLIFEKFGRGTTTGQAKPGAGLGLYIARSIAEAHGGSLEVRSGRGQGATFTLRLPAASA